MSGGGVQRKIGASGVTDAFRQRMERQCLAIERYRLGELRRGRLLSLDEAALESIERYAAEFGGTGDLS